MTANEQKLQKAVNTAKGLLILKRSLSKSVTIYMKPKIIKGKTILGKIDPSKYKETTEFDYDFEIYMADLSVALVKDAIFVSVNNNNIIVQYEDYTEDISKALNGVI